MKKTTMKKALAVFLAIVITLSTLPFIALAAPASSELDGIIVDAPTIKEWKEYLGTAVNGAISTEHSGFIWSDKSVFVDGGAYGTFEDYFPGLGTKLAVGRNNFGQSNFLVGLSTIGSSTEITGYSVTPTDTMLVLDLSNSMDQSNSVPSLIAAANDAIESLLELNLHNRVGVVLFSGNSNFGASNTSTGKVVLPLGRYVSNASGKFLSFTGDSDTTVRVANGVKYEGPDGKEVPANSKNTIGGTYIQNGLYQAYNQFPRGNDTVIADDKIQAGTQRMPILVLMTDGAPTTATVNYSNVGTSDSGNGGNTNAEYSFLTQLTASWVNESLKVKYNGTDPKFYTLGLNTSNDTSATGVLNPSSNSNAAKSYWDVFSRNRVITIDDLPYATSGDRDVTLRMPTGMTLNRNYVDETWNASSSNGLISAFEEIVEEIKIQSRYYGTLVTTGDYENDGYIYFTDEIGSYMEVKNFKGIHLGEGKLYTGANFAKDIKNDFYYTNNTITEEGKALYAALAERLSIDETTVQTLLNIAEQNGYISYINDDVFSNYIAWYADEDNGFVGVYNPQTKSNVPSNAKYLVKSYIFEGEVTASHAKSDMLFALIRVRENLATGRQILDAALPASLLPMVTNKITVNTDNVNFTSANITSVTNNADEMHPAVLLYEVGLDSDITPYNITSFVKEDFRKNADGTYSFYSNRWRDDNGNTPSYNVSGELMDEDLHTTGVNYTPSYQNETYYYTNDTVIYKPSGNGYVAVGANETLDAENNQYYWAKRFITKSATGTMGITEKYEPISKETAADTTGNIIGTKNGNKIVKAGTPRKIVRDAAEKADNNPTGTIKYSEIAAVDKFGTVGGTEYHVYFFHGNNGKATVKPAQGIKLTKTVSETVAGANNEFVFDIELSGNEIASQYAFRHEKADGTVLNGNVSVGAGNIVTVTLGAGDIYYLTDLADGVTYTVTERYNAYYVAASTNNSGTVAEYTLNAVDFVNTPRGYGSLMVEKEINHSFDTLTNALASKQFDIKVTLRGQGADGAFYYDAQSGQNVYAAAVAGEEFTYAFNFKLTDAQSLLISNIPEGVEYTVEELNIPNGFTLQDGTRTGAIANDSVSRVLLINEYEPTPLVPNITVSGVKNIYPASYVWDDEDVYYVQIEQIDLSTGNTIGNGYTSRLYKDRKYYDIAFADFLPAIDGEYTKPGVYVYKIYEYEFNPVTDISYDKSIGLFAVTVEDNATGELTVTKVEAIQDLVSVVQNGNNWTVTKDFTNIYQSYQETFNVHKVVNGTNGNAHRGGIIFGLFETQNAATPIMSAITNANGVATFTLNILQSDYATEQTYYVREIAPSLEERVVGMTYNTDTYYTVTVDWSDDTAATPTVTYKNAAGGIINGRNDLIITNDYDDSVVSTPDIKLSGIKTFKNADGTDRAFDGREFNFIAYTSNATFTAKTQLHKVGYNESNGKITFPDITFDRVGTYYLIIEEEQGTLGGVNYDKSQYYVLINVVKAEENGKTVLKTDSVRVYKGGNTNLLTQDQINFNNTYTITDNESVTISGIKNLIGRPINPGEFRFNLVETADDYQTVLANGITRYALNGTPNDNNKHKAEFTFEKIEFTKPGTHYFVVTEEIPTDTNGVTYSTESYGIKVEIKDNNNGGLEEPVITYIDGDVEFTNTYNALSTSVGFIGKKTLKNKDLTADAFTFELHETGKDFIVDTDAFGLPVTDKNNEQGYFGFTLTYEQGEEGHYYYVIKEYIPDERFGIHYDTNEYHIEIVVIDNGLGKMTSYAVVNLFGGESNISLTAINFTNTYAAVPTETTIFGEKNLTGRDMVADEFEFELYLANDKFEKQGEALAAAKNDANGSFTFSYPVEIISEGVQYFTVVEKNLGAEHIAYDNTVYGVKITATDNGAGEYTVVKEIVNVNTTETVTEIEFNNTYTPPVPNVPVTGDYANFTSLIALMFISGGAFAGAVFFGKKRKEQN